MPREIVSKGATALAICGGQLVLLPKARKPLPDYLANHPDIVNEDKKPEEEQRFEVVENGGEPVKTIDKTEAARPAGVDDLEELSGETKAAAPADSPITKSADAISVVPPASPGPSTDHNPAYNSGKGVSMVPPPQEVTDAQAADAAAAAGEGDQGDGDETVADKTETAEPLPEGWERFNKDDLVALCTEREIDPEGNKADLKERLQSWQDEHPPKDE